MANGFNNLYEFADFRFDRGRGRLSRNGDPIPLSPKASELLALLLANNGEFVSKEEIFNSVWKDTFVEDGVLTQNVYVLRKALGKDADGRPLIENRARFGYRVTVPVSRIEPAEKDEQAVSALIDEPHPAATEATRKRESSRQRMLAWPLLAALIAISLGILAWYYLPSIVSAWLRKPIESVKYTRLTNSGDLASSVISPDGNLIAYIRGDGLYLKDINTEKELKIDVPNVRSFSSVNFSPNGEYLYFRNNRVLSTQAAIMRVSLLGGEAVEVIERSWGSFSLSPDGKKVAYILNVPPIAKFNLRVRDLETAEEKEFFAAEQPHSPCVICAPAWSPDSSRIIFSTNIPTATGQLFLVDLVTDKKEEIKLGKLRRFQQAAWLPDGESFIVSATEGSRFFHLWKAYLPDGELEPVTNGLSSYTGVSISADGTKVLALRADETANIFVADTANLSEPRQVTFGSHNSFGQNGLHWIDEKRILYSSQTEQNLADNLAIVNIENGSSSDITNERRNSFRVPVSNGTMIWYSMNKDGASQIFQMTIDGKDIRQLTSGSDGQRRSPRLTSDSRYLFYVRRGPGGSSIMRLDLQNQTEEEFFSNPDYQPGPFLELSPDNKYLTFSRLQNRPANSDDDLNLMVTVVSVEDTSNINTFPVAAVPPIRRFSPDSRSIDYLYAVTDATQIVRQSFNGGEIRPVFTSAQGEIFNFAWSKSGKQLALSCGLQTKDAVLLTDFN
ncbi:MAG: winged helix-turn-helix domain-containing protein [Pyrinomonadaceae bacterium]